MQHIVKKGYRHHFPNINQETGECTAEQAKAILSKPFKDTGKPFYKGLNAFDEHPDIPTDAFGNKTFVNPNPAKSQNLPRENKEGFNSSKKESKPKESK